MNWKRRGRSRTFVAHERSGHSNPYYRTIGKITKKSSTSRKKMQKKHSAATALSFKNAERIRKSCYFIALTNGLEIDV